MRTYTSFMEALRGLNKTGIIGRNNDLYKNLSEKEEITILPIEEIIRWGYEVNLDIYRTLLLILKVLWEKYQKSEEHTEKETDEDKFSILDKEDILVSHFHPRTQDVYFAFQKVYQEHLAGSETLEDIDALQYGDYDERVLGSLIQEMLLNRLYFLPITSEAVLTFIEKKTNEQQILKQSSEKLQQDYWIAKCIWIELQEELAELLMLLESSRLQNGYIMREFLKIFGNSYIELKEQIIRVLSLKRRMMLKETHPAWSKDEIEKTVKDLEKDEEKEIERLKYSAKMADLVQDIKAEGSMDTKTLNDYKKR